MTSNERVPEPSSPATPASTAELRSEMPASAVFTREAKQAGRTRRETDASSVSSTTGVRNEAALAVESPPGHRIPEISPEWFLLMPAAVIAAASVSAVVVDGVVAGRVVNTLSASLHAALVVVSVVPGGVVGTSAGGLYAAPVVIGIVRGRVVMAPCHDVNMCWATVSVVVGSGSMHAAETGKRHASLQGFQNKTPLIPL
jgi:hypothetical protein